MVAVGEGEREGGRKLKRRWVIKNEADANLRCAWWGQYRLLVDCEASQSPINKHGLVIPNFFVFFI